MMRKITQMQFTAPMLPSKKRVAAYTRVSSGKDAMLHSLSAQISYYSDYIQKHSGWEYCGVYTDKALTGTKDNRPEFQRLLSDCRNHKLDLVITKSIARFARNTVTMLLSVRELCQLGIDVYFEKENIHSISGDGELMLSILASFAQEESRSTSENCRWRIQKGFEQGRLPSITLLGYRRTAEGGLEIEPNEAEIARMIFADYLSGMGKNLIMKKLNDFNIPTRRGNRWREGGIDTILRNEKYKGDMLLQKTFTSNHIDKEKRINQGQLPMYFVENSHEPIVSKEDFAKVQELLKSKAEKFSHPEIPLQSYPFTSKIICGNCKKFFHHKIANAGGKYQKPIWICPTFNTYGKKQCGAKQIPEDILKEICSNVLQLQQFDATIFEQQISQIQVPENGILRFVFRDGHCEEKQWQNRSRKESWDEKARQAAKERQLSIAKRRKSECKQQEQ